MDAPKYHQEFRRVPLEHLDIPLKDVINANGAYYSRTINLYSDDLKRLKEISQDVSWEPISFTETHVIFRRYVEGTE